MSMSVMVSEPDGHTKLPIRVTTYVIGWTRNSVDELCAKEDVATLRYPKDGPKRAADTIKEFDIVPGFKASVVASEPLINKPIAMAYLAANHALPNHEVYAEVRGKRQPMRVTALPFVPHRYFRG